MSFARTAAKMSPGLLLSVGDRSRGVSGTKRVVPEIRPLETVEDEQRTEIQRPGQPVDVLDVDLQLPRQQVEHVVVDVVLDLEAHRRAEPAARELLLHRGEEVLRVVLLDLDVLVAGHSERRVLMHLHAREQLVEVRGDDVLQRDVPHVVVRCRGAHFPLRTSRGSDGGTLMRAKCSLPVFGLTRVTARFRDKPEM
jgi:hypothetical protein